MLVPGDRLAKSVVIEDADRYWVVLIPSTRRLDFTSLHRALGRQVGLATEEEVRALFGDCAPGAVPALAQAYGLVLIDDALLDVDDVCFEAGDHYGAGTDGRPDLPSAHARGRTRRLQQRDGEPR